MAQRMGRAIRRAAGADRRNQSAGRPSRRRERRMARPDHRRRLRHGHGPPGVGATLRAERGRWCAIVHFSEASPPGRAASFGAGEYRGHVGRAARVASLWELARNRLERNQGHQRRRRRVARRARPSRTLGAERLRHWLGGASNCAWHTAMSKSPRSSAFDLHRGWPTTKPATSRPRPGPRRCRSHSPRCRRAGPAARASTSPWQWPSRRRTSAHPARR